eukprot:scaffold4745_cov125-Isochrysis_galbana.AAC.6
MTKAKGSKKRARGGWGSRLPSLLFLTFSFAVLLLASCSSVSPRAVGSSVVCVVSRSLSLLAVLVCSLLCCSPGFRLTAPPPPTGPPAGPYGAGPYGTTSLSLSGKQLRARVEGSRWRRSSFGWSWSPLRWFWPRTKVLRVPA